MVESFLARPERHCGTGVLVLSGSSGALERERCELLAAAGAVALSVRWFGGPGQPRDPFLIPLETFGDAIDRLARDSERLAVVGSSFGAEAALLTAVHDHRVDVAVGLAPSPVVWAGIDSTTDPPAEGSHWTLAGSPLPYAPFDPAWEPDADPPAYRGLYALSLATAPPDAWIPVERIRGEVVVAGGEDDQVWPAADFARLVAARRADLGRATTVLTHARAGHRVVLPGEQPVSRGQVMARGGSPEADRELGQRVWTELVRVLRLRP